MPITPHYKPWSISFFGVLIICIFSIIFFYNLNDQFNKAESVYKAHQGLNSINKEYSFYLKMVAEKRAYHLRLNELALQQFKIARLEFTKTQAETSQYLFREQDRVLYQKLSAQYNIRVAQLDRHIQYLSVLPISEALLKINSEYGVSVELENAVRSLFDQLAGQLNTYSTATEKERMRLQRVNIISFIVITVLGLLLIIIVNFLQTKFGRLKIKKEISDENLQLIQKAETQLREEKQRMLQIIEGTRAGTWEWNVQTGETKFNEIWANMIGYTLDELQPININTWIRFVHPDDAEQSSIKLQACFDKETNFYECECRMKHKKGHWIWVLDRGKVTSWTEDGKPLWMFGTHTEITNVKETELALRESNAFIEAVLNNINTGIVACNAEGVLTLFNNATRKMHGIPNTAIAADEWSRYYHLLAKDGVTPLETKDVPLYKAWKGQAFHNDEIVISNISGELIYVRTNGAQFKDQNGQVLGAVVGMEDITELKQIQKVLEEREQKFRGIFDSTFQFIGFLTLDGTLIEANKTALDFAGLVPADVIGKKFWDCYWWQISEETQVQLKQNFEKALLGEIVLYEVAVWDKDQKPVTILFNLKPVFDAQGKVVAIIPEGRPIQDIVEAREALSQKNLELERFAATAAHDLKEPLRMISGFMTLMKDRYGGSLDETATKYIAFAVDGAKRMDQLISDLLTYAKIGSADVKKIQISLDHLLQGILSLQESVITEKQATITWDTLPDIYGQVTAIRVLFNNLISNALKYQQDQIPPQVHISVKESLTEWQFCISDNGIGIPVEQAENIFILFKRLHARNEYAGTGMGLATCKKIVELHGGRIWFEPVTEGRGSRFYFTIPRE